MNPRVSLQHQVATVNQVPGMQDNAGRWEGRKAMPLDMPQGKTKASKSLAGTLRLLWELQVLSVLQERQWKLCFDKRHPNIGTSPQMVLPLLALTSGGEYNCEEVLDQTHTFQGG